MESSFNNMESSYNNNCNIVNRVWIDKGIILTVLYYLIKKYNKLLNKKIIIEITRYRILFKILFPKLNFYSFEKDDKNNFYFNIRKIIKKQDVIIDYINNYDYIIQASKIKLVPWFDMNDILISYIYNEKEKLYLDKYLNFIINFNKCRRGNYNNEIYDKYIENKIFEQYLNFNNKFTINDLNNIIDKYIYKYTDTVKTYIIPVTNENNNKNQKLIEEITQKIEVIKDIIKNIEFKKDTEIKSEVKKIINEDNITQISKNIKNNITINIKKKYNKILNNYKKLKQFVNNATLYVNNEFSKKDNMINTLLDTLDVYTEISIDLEKNNITQNK
jgi:hypothetical protein